MDYTSRIINNLVEYIDSSHLSLSKEMFLLEMFNYYNYMIAHNIYYWEKL